MKNKHYFYMAVVVVLLATLACSLGSNSGGGNGADSPDYQATESALEKTQSALEAAANQPDKPDTGGDADPQPAPTNPPPPTTAPEPTTPPVPADPVSGDILYYTDFDGPEDWEEGWIHFPIPSTNDGYSVYKDDGVMHIEVPDTYTTVYLFNEDYFFEDEYADVYVETAFQNLSTHNINNISVMCRATEKGWYEFAMLSGGLWYIYRYDAETGAYHTINDGGIPDLDYDAPHSIGGECVGSQLTIWFDGEPLRNGTIKDTYFREGQVGFSLYAHDWQDVIVDFDYFGVLMP